MIDGVEYYPINLIDEEETIKNGKRICVLYRPLIEKRMKQILTTPMNSASIVTFTGNQRNNHAFEDKLIERCAWNYDQVTKFINNILILEQSDKIAGQFLKEKYIYDKYDKEILEDLNISKRTLIYHKKEAYYKIAIWSNQVVYIDNKATHFENK